MARFAVVVASAASVAAELCAGNHYPWATVGICAAWAGVAYPTVGIAALAAVLPALAVVPDSGWWTFAGWTATALAGCLALECWRRPSQDRLQTLRNELRDVEHERRLLSQHLQRYPALIESSLELSAARDFDQFAAILCRRVRDLLPETNEVLVFIGYGREQSCRASLNRRGETCARLAGSDERYVAAEARSLVRRHRDELHALIPLRSDRRHGSHQEQPLRGVLAVRLEINALGDRLALEILDALGRLCGLGLVAVDLVHQARTFALHDDLTGLFGQHEFLRRLDETAAHSQRRNIALGVIMCDLDHLKAFNDRFGHSAGDAALRAVAMALRKALPSQAIVCRYGGEEFGALLVGVTHQQIMAIAEKVRIAISETVPDDEHPDRRVTASVGVALLSAKEDGRTLLVRADKSLYRAKANGRNRVECASQEPS